MSVTNDLTNDIIRAFFSIGVYAIRQNVLPIPISVSGQVVGYRPPPVTGIPDIQSFVPGGLSTQWPYGGGCLFVEIKTGKDRLRESQKIFHGNARHCGCVVLVVKTYDDFINQVLSVLNLLSEDKIKKLIYATSTKASSNSHK